MECGFLRLILACGVMALALVACVEHEHPPVWETITGSGSGVFGRGREPEHGSHGGTAGFGGTTPFDAGVGGEGGEGAFRF